MHSYIIFFVHSILTFYTRERGNQEKRKMDARWRCEGEMVCVTAREMKQKKEQVKVENMGQKGMDARRRRVGWIHRVTARDFR